MRGALPKPPDQRVSRYRPIGWVDVPNVKYTGEKPDLPDDVPQLTREWWDVISSMPHCILWHPSEWQLALDTALLHAAFVKGDLARAAELRKWEHALGVTMDARRAQRIRYVDPLPEEPEPEIEESSPQVSDFAEARRRKLMEKGGE
jgi:hypothetical protein